MSEYPLHSLAVYNPALLSADELKRYFVARQPLMNQLLDDLRREQPGNIPQHRLLLGLRGMGKTTLLHRLALAVSEDETLNTQWLALTFPEEQYNIASLSDLWLNCLDALGDKLERSGAKTAVEQLDQHISSLQQDDAQLALQVLLDQANSQGKRLLLLIDNIDLIFERLKDQHWVLRETLQAEPRLLIIGASSTAIEASYQYDAAFYDFFKLDELKGLTSTEMRDTLLTIAQIKHNNQVETLIKKDLARIQTMHTLTGGNPRTTVLLYNVLAQGLEDGDVRSDLEGLLDQVTPLYKARFEELPAQAQQLVDALAIHWDPLTANKLAEQLRWDVNKVSAQLNRLQQLGLIEKQPPAEGKRNLFQIGERFFNIWYLMRASRRVRRKLIWLVQFLRMFFSAEELLNHAHTRLSNNMQHLQDAEYSLALAQSLDQQPLRKTLEHHALSHLLEHNQTREELYDILDLDGDDAELLPTVEHLQALAEIRQQVKEALQSVEIDVDKEYLCLMLLGSADLTINDKRGISHKAKHMSNSQWLELATSLQREQSKWHNRFGKIADQFCNAIASGEIRHAKDLVGAQVAAEHYRAPELLAIVSLIGGQHPSISGENIVNACKQLLEKHSSPRIYYSLGNLLKNHLQRYDEAEAAYRKAIELDASFAYPWNGLGNLLQNHLQRYDEAEAACRKAIALNPDNPMRLDKLAWFLYKQNKHPEEARNLALKAVGKDDNLNYLHTLVTILLNQQDWSTAAPYLRRFIEKASGEFLDDIWSGVLTTFKEAIAFGQAQQALELLDDSGAGERWRPLREALMVIVSTNPRYLNSVAAEIRAPAEKILEQLQPQDN